MKIANELFKAADSKREEGGVQMRQLTSKTREYIKKFLGEYHNFCPDLKYRVLESLMKRVVLEK